MPGQGRLGDKANVPVDAHGCPACPHNATGPAIIGSPTVLVNGLPALRVDDVGVHAACCAMNMFIAHKGSTIVFIDGKPAHRKGDQTKHCGGNGTLIEGSTNVIVGEEPNGGAGAAGGAAGGKAGQGGGGGGGGGPGGGGGSPGNNGVEPGGGGGDQPGANDGPGGNDAPVDPTEVDPDQIEIHVVSKPGAAQPDVLFELKLPDGGEKTGTTDAGGMIRFSGLTTSGNARLVLPEIDEHVVDDEPAQAGRVRYARGGVDAPVGELTTVEVVPRIRRGRLFGMLFEIDKCFLLPGAMQGIRGLTRYYNEHPGLHVLVSGHTDPTGDDQYNRDLSNERGQSVADFLTDNVDGWLAYYSNGYYSKRWGVREDQHMLSALSDEAGPYYTGPIDGQAGAGTQDAVTRFQTKHGLAVDGVAGPETRRALVTEYMQQDETTLPPGTPLEVHGCGEFHPAEPSENPDVNAEDRRVEIFLFEGPVDPPAQNPCPAPGCREYPIWRDRVFEDVDFRTDPPPDDPVLTDPRFEAAAPEGTKPVEVTLYSLRREPCPDCMATVLVDDARKFARSDGSGVLHLDVPTTAKKLVVRYVPAELVTPIEMHIDLELPPVSDDAGAIKRLVHLGYPADTDLQFSVFRFQSDFGVASRTGQLDGETRQRLAAIYDEGKAK
jgi:outer membrane protein OmpA-like peptidoglycan-associated protein/uncharacterized Zn-binding protein involved in type VI secretion